MIAEILKDISSLQVFFAVIAIYVISKFISWYRNPLRKIPGPKGSLLFGNTADFSAPNDGHKVLVEWGRKYGEVFKTWTSVGGYRVYFLNPAHIKQILVSQSTKFERPKFLRKLLNFTGRTLFSSEGKEHAMQRRMLNPAFSYGNVQKFLPLFNEKAKQLVKSWKHKISDMGGPFEELILDEFTHLTLDVIGESAFGYSFNSILKGNSKESMATDTILRGGFNLQRRALESWFPFLKYIPSEEREKVDEATNVMNGIIDKVIKDRREEMASGENPERTDLLQSLLKMKDDAGDKFADEDLNAQVRMFMIAGHETTSMSLTWTTLLLAKHPEFQERVRDEIRSILKDEEEITGDHLQKMKFLDHCIKESMRLYPAAIQTGRGCLVDVKIGPYEIPKGTVVFAGIASAHRDLEFWDDADQFNPDRYDQPEAKADATAAQYRYFPFSRGPRMCIGYRFAEAELKLVLAQVLREFSFKLGKNQSSDFKAELVLTLRPSPAPMVEISTAA
eukprot:Seg1077.10 transcript_id=Seg1077.10/GoldUCD/mRNA.D3Y31 product="Cytochrome P450 4F12" protein_id=Seg1077.10/GoldUCD/D3Y31